jgi:hypothetical protein
MTTRTRNPLTGYAAACAPDTTPLPDVAEVNRLLITLRNAGVFTYREVDMAQSLLASQLNAARAAERAVIVDHWVSQLKAFGQFGAR